MNDEGDLRYKMLVLNELYFVRSNAARIESVAKKLYEQKINQKSGEVTKDHNLFLTLNFKRLEKLCEDFFVSDGACHSQ
ncbi:MAG: type III toxin-antitoxin system ToxN/AbiQ family toxin [Treponema sp.]|nr:type III toxin-antitoxin system ToxN/AbiQ family toxin [Treponema sp.]